MRKIITRFRTVYIRGETGLERINISIYIKNNLKIYKKMVKVVTWKLECREQRKKKSKKRSRKRTITTYCLYCFDFLPM